MSKENNKIYFSNSPFINGHKVVDFVWNARLDKNFNIVMDLHLESDQYDQEDEYEDIIEEIDNVSDEMTEKSLWINYDHCVLSSTFWGNKGISIATDKEKLDFASLNNYTFLLDTLPVDLTQAEENFAFGMSMLGKDIVANHEITFLDTDEFGVYDIKWKGKVANTYLGENTFDYDFYVYMKKIKFGGIKIDPSLDSEEVIKFLDSKLVNKDEFELLKTEENSLEDYILRLKMK
ncbi:MAG: hypothetical protein KIG88_10435 [Weeksellaceae bacterium]|nr:hypothetical protein [Weeksellaceae bacterium]